MIVAVALITAFASEPQLSAPLADRPAFDIPLQYECIGSNTRGDQVDVLVKIAGDAKQATFVFTPAKGSAWPKGELTIGPVWTSFFRSEKDELWYWVGVQPSNKNAYDFGFDVNLTGRASLRFGRQAHQRFTNDEFKPDPLGSQHLNCYPIESDRVKS